MSIALLSLLVTLILGLLLELWLAARRNRRHQIQIQFYQAMVRRHSAKVQS